MGALGRGPRRSCTEDPCPGAVLDVTLDIADAVARGRSPDDALGACLAGHCDAHAVVQVIFGSAAGARVVTWPDSRHVTALRAALERVAPTLPSLVSELTRSGAACLSGSQPATWRFRQTQLVLRQAFRCADLALVGFDGPVPRLVVLAADHHFDRHAVHVLGCLREPLASLLRAVGTPHAPGPAARSPDVYDDPGLSPREVEVLRLVAQGLLARTVAARLHVSTRTVDKHLGSAYRKLDAHDRLSAVRRAERLGLLDGEDTPTRLPHQGLAWTLRW